MIISHFKKNFFYKSSDEVNGSKLLLNLHRSPFLDVDERNLVLIFFTSPFSDFFGLSFTLPLLSTETK